MAQPTSEEPWDSAFREFRRVYPSRAAFEWFADVYEATKEAGELDGLLEVVQGIVESGNATKH